MITVSLGAPFWRGTLTWVGIAFVGAALTVLVPTTINTLLTKRIDYSASRNWLYFMEYCAITLSVPFILMLSTGVHRLRGIAPITLGLFSILGLVPYLGTRSTGWLIHSLGSTGADYAVMIGMYSSFFLLAPLAGWVACTPIDRSRF
jgi:hypothetical protein